MVPRLSQPEKRERLTTGARGYALAGHHGHCLGADRVEIINIDCEEQGSVLLTLKRTDNRKTVDVR